MRKPINYYLEGSEDPDKVLDIFVRVNSGGTTLSYSDLLLSMATNQWQQHDAREEVRALVTELNSGGSREFSFSKDVVLKTALMIAGVDMRFRVSNFTETNMLKVEERWDLTRASLLRAATLLDRFGFSGRSLTADSVVIPIAYFLASKGHGDSYLDSTSFSADRKELQTWVNRSLVKRGIWGSGLDTTLSRIRQAIDAHVGPGFPVSSVQQEMAAIGKGLDFGPDEVDELLGLKYGGQRTFPVLAMLYPGLDLSQSFHEDHVYPKSRFTPKQLMEAGVPSEDVDAFKDAVDRLPNLQLLRGKVNMEKQAMLPGDWLKERFASESQRQAYISENDLTVLPELIPDFFAFFDARRASIRKRLHQALGVSEGQSS